MSKISDLKLLSKLKVGNKVLLPDICTYAENMDHISVVYYEGILTCMEISDIARQYCFGIYVKVNVNKKITITYDDCNLYYCEKSGRKCKK